MNRLDRSRGSLVGLAVGDALGTTNEFKSNPAPISDMVGGGAFGLKPGEWTDDTSMALCLADSLIACGGFDARDQMERYVRWWREGYNSVRGRCFDIGNTTASALRHYLETSDPYAGDPSPYAAGNGSLMRLCPVAIYYQRDEDEAVRYAGESSRTTHAVPQAVDCCRYYAALMCRALGGASKEDVLASALDGVHPEVAAVAAGFRSRTREQLKPTGYVVHSMEAALWCFAHSGDFREGCLLAANLGGDADTIAAIYGQLAGAHYGESGIPAGWLELLAWADAIRERADRLHG